MLICESIYSSHYYSVNRSSINIKYLYVDVM